MATNHAVQNTVYVLVQPHDDYTFEAPDDAMATALVSLLNGMYGWEAEGRSGGFGDLLPEDKQGEMVESVKGVLEGRRAELAAAMRTVEIKAEQRRRLGVEPQKWHDEMRTSVSDPRALALRMADRLEAT